MWFQNLNTHEPKKNFLQQKPKTPDSDLFKKKENQGFKIGISPRNGSHTDKIKTQK